MSETFAVPVDAGATTTGPDYDIADLVGNDIDIDLDDHSDELSPLEALAAEAAAQDGIPTVDLMVDGRNGWSARFRTDVDGKKLDELQDKCRMPTGKKGADGKRPVNNQRFEALILLVHNIGLFYNGRPFLDDAGDPVTYRSDEFMSKMRSKVTEHRIRMQWPTEAPVAAADVLMAWYATPGRVAATAKRILDESGYTDDALDAVDPTNAD